MAGSTRRRTESVDAIWLSMDRPSNRMVIVALMFLDSRPDWDEVVRLLQARVLDRYPVFHQRPAPAPLGLGLPLWEDDPAFDLDRHVKRLTLAEPGDDHALQSHVEDHLHLSFDPHHPLWEVHLIDGHGDGAVVFSRTHHAMADGISLARVLLSLTDSLTDEEGAASRGGTHGRSRTSPRLHVAAAEDAAQAAPADGHALHQLRLVPTVTTGAALVRDGLGRMRRLGTPAGGAALVQSGIRTVEVVGQLLLTHSPPSVLSGEPSAYKRVVWTRPLPLDALKEVAHLEGGTLNDVLMGAMAGALCRYQQEHGRAPVDLVTMVPVNLRRPDRPLPPSLGNRFALVFFTYPSGTTRLLARLAETKRRMDWLKQSPEAPLTFALMGLIARTVPPVERALVDFFADKAIGVTTNVMGPTSRRALAGVPVGGVLGWVPGSGRQTLGTCIFTYAGSVQVGLMADAALVPDPEALLAAFEDEAAALVRLAD
ncbi:wax ester/triacylglycerol synthase family O-acyltransferase [Phycicoccus ginsengisoli]